MFYLSSLNKLFNIKRFQLFFLLSLLVIYAFLEIVGIGFLITIVINFLNFDNGCVFENRYIDLLFLCNIKKNELIIITVFFIYLFSSICLLL